MGDGQYGRRPDKDGVCLRCKTDGYLRDRKRGIGRAIAFYKAPVKNKKGRVVRQAEWVFHCLFHGVEVPVAA